MITLRHAGGRATSHSGKDSGRSPLAALCYACLRGAYIAEVGVGYMPKRREWAENAAMYAIGIPAMAIAFSAAEYVHENAPQWEAPIAVVSLALAILAAIWYWRVRRHGWMVSILSVALLLISFMAAYMHGWQIQAYALVLGAIVVVLVGASVSLARFTRDFESVMREAGEELNGDPLFRRETLFRDDGQRITVYPRWRQLALQCGAQAAVLTGIGWVLVFLRLGDLWPRILIGLFALILLIVFLTTLFRLVKRRTSLVVGPDGICDDGTLIWSGVGLIPWDDILTVMPSTRSSGWVKQHFLAILVSDLPRIRRRLPLVKRLAFVNTFSGMSQLLIPQSMLDTPVDDLSEQIALYVDTHAPPGWRDGVAEDDEPTPPTPSPVH